MTTDLEARFDFRVRQGDKWGRWFRILDDAGEPVDWTGKTFKMQLRRALDAAVAIELSTDNGRLVNGGDNGTVTLNALTAATATVEPGTYDYSLRVYASGEPTTLIVGTIEVLGSTTR